MELKLIFLSFLVVQISGAPQILIREYNIPYSNGRYEYGYETSDGTYRNEVGVLKEIPNGPTILVIEGSYSFIAPNKKVFTVKYISDENGYRTLPINQQTEKLLTSFRNTEPVVAYDEGIDNRVAIPPDLIGSLLGRR